LKKIQLVSFHPLAFFLGLIQEGAITTATGDLSTINQLLVGGHIAVQECA
jgi:hypothetical protein